MLSNPLLLAGDDAGYQIQRSLRFRSSATAYLRRTTPVTATDTKKFTHSFWFKRGTLTGVQQIHQSGSSGTNTAFIELSNGTGAAGDVINITDYQAAYSINLTSTQVFRDPSAWYHIVLAVDTTQATAADRVKVYANGVQITSWTTATYPALNAVPLFNAVIDGRIGGWWNTTRSFDGYLSEVNFIDGQALTPSSFGQTDPTTGQWTAKRYTGTYGTNGFYLPFTDTTSTTTLCHDASGNGNNWTPTGISLSGSTWDAMLDVPLGGGGLERGNYAVLSPLNSSTYRTLTDGNLRSTGNTSTDSGLSAATFPATTGKIVWEQTVVTTSSPYPEVGCVTNIPANGNGSAGNLAVATTLGINYRSNGSIYKNSNVLIGSFTALSAGNVVRFELDVDALTCAIYRNNTLITTVTGLTGSVFYPAACDYNGSVVVTNLGQRPWEHTPTTGFKALHTGNLADPAIKKPNLHFDVVLATGANIKTSTEAVFPSNFLEWIKDRGNSNNHQIIDTVRGASAVLQSNTTAAETTYAAPSGSSVGWAWKAGGAAVTNTAGSITSQVSANQAAGFSVVTWVGNLTSGATVGHGLGVAPKLILFFNRSIVGEHPVYSSVIGASNYLYIQGTNASAAYAGFFNNTAPTPSVFSLGNDARTNGSGNNLVAYCFSEIAGYSKIGSYTGNGSADGPFVFCGFRPRYVLVKRSDSTSNWTVVDTARDTYNPLAAGLYPNLSNSESTPGAADITATGFKIRNTFGDVNTSGGTYIFMAIAEAPFKTALAR